jgi:hypothetical protein
MCTLNRKGEEAGELAERLVELKNHMLDSVVFEESYHVCRIVDPADKKKYPSLDMVFSFVRDASRFGELFLQISVPSEQIRKFVPILAVAYLDTRDNVKFQISMCDEFSDILFDESINDEVNVLSQKKFGANRFK